MKKSDRHLAIIQDTREQRPFRFPASFEHGGQEWTVSVEVATLQTGDYSLAGHEGQITVERKASMDEIAGNVGKGRVRFHREMARMRSYRTALIVVCEPFESIWFPKYNRNMAPDVVRANLDTIQERYRVPIRFCDNTDEAMLYTLAAFRRFYTAWHRDQKGA